MNAIYPGSFNPFTLGHLSIAIRASKLFDNLLIAYPLVEESQDKIRKEIILESLREYNDIKNISVLGFSGLTTDFAIKNDCKVLVRGIRNTVDFEYEKSLAKIYKDCADIEVINLFSENEHISATIIRELVKYGGEIERYVSKNAIKLIKTFYK